MNKHLLLTVSALCILVLFSCSESKKTEPERVTNPASQGSELPFLFSDDTGKVFMSWVNSETGSDKYKLIYSRWDDNNWTNPKTLLSSDSWFINWADFPSIVAYSGEALAAHVLKKIPGSPYSYNVNLTLNAGGGIWSEPFPPHNDSTATEHGFVSMIPMDRDRIMTAWLDGRRTEDRKDEEYFNLDKAMTLRSAEVSLSGDIINRDLIDKSVCDCCQTSMVMTDEGPFVTYRNRTDEEIRDIYYSRFISGQWTEPAAVYNDNWKIGACPVNGPKAAAKDSLVVVAWFTGANDKRAVKAAVSTDYGKSFHDPLLVNDSNTLGRVDLAVDKSGTIYVSEISKDNGKHYLSVHLLDYQKGTVNTKRITEISGSRRSGFPQMELANGNLIFAWTDVKDDTLTRVQTATLKL